MLILLIQTLECTCSITISPLRRYLPILRGFPAKYIYDPWNAPESVQKAAKCIIGVHYPKPMVHHAEASRLNIERMKQIYQQLSCYRGLGKDTTVASFLTDICSSIMKPAEVGITWNANFLVFWKDLKKVRWTNDACKLWLTSVTLPRRRL